MTKRSKSAENAFLNVYKVLAEAPDPYPLLEAAVVCSLLMYAAPVGRLLNALLHSQDQTVKVAEARELEYELQRMRDENAELRRKLAETASLEAAKKKAETRIEHLEQKVRQYGCDGRQVLTHTADGRHGTGESHAEGERTERNL